MKSLQKPLPMTLQFFKSICFLFISLLLVNCNNDDEPETPFQDPCDTVMTIGENMILNDDEVPIYSATLDKEERVDGLKVYSFKVQFYENSCRQITSFFTSFRLPIDQETIENRTYDLRSFIGNIEEGSVPISFRSRSLDSNGFESLIEVSGTMEVITNGPDNFTFDISAMAESNRNFNILLTHQF